MVRGPIEIVRILIIIQAKEGSFWGFNMLKKFRNLAES